jgi:UDP-glucose:(heptosyl)LPS alpha-1,3-glucosyltransferase
VLSLDKVVGFTHLHAGGGTHKSFLQIRRRNDTGIGRFFRRFSPFHRYILHLEKKGFESPYIQKVRCNSNLVLKDIRRDYGVPLEKLIVVPSGIRWKEMGPVFDSRGAVADTLRRRHRLHRDWNLLLFLGSGFSRKGLEIAVQGLDCMPQDYHLVVVGKGRPAVYQNVAADLGLADRVHFLGPQPDGWRYAAMCRALVLPSQYDPFGGAAAEGHAMGLPVLVSDKTGYADAVIHGQNGVILDTPMTVAHVRQAFHTLHSLIEDPSWTAEQLRDHARRVDDDSVLEKLLEDFLAI